MINGFDNNMSTPGSQAGDSNIYINKDPCAPFYSQHSKVKNKPE